MSRLVILAVWLFHYVYGQTDSSLEANRTDFCINELDLIHSNQYLNLSNPSKISPNYSVATSVAYHNSSSTILIAGDFFYIDPKNTTNRTYYQFFKAFSHSKDNKFDIKYSNYMRFNNAVFGNKYISHKSLRSWTRIIAHPSLSYFYLLGINNLTAYNINNGEFMWTAQITPCSTKKHSIDRAIIYNDATFFKSDNDYLYVAGTCVDETNLTVAVLDQYSVKNGEIVTTFRQLHNFTDLGFFNNKYINDIIGGIGEIPPEITISAPINESITTTVVDKYFYVGFTHLMFTGMARIEHDIISNEWRVKKWIKDDWTLVNPSFVSHRNLVTTNNGLISLLDPSINGIISLFLGKMRHFTRWETKKSALGQIEEDNIYNKFTWYGGHEKYDLHLDWTLYIDPLSNYNDIYVITAPLELPTVRNSTIAQHDMETGEVIGGAQLPFYALDSIVTNDAQLVTVGFEWTPSLNSYLERTAVFAVYDSEIMNDSSSSCIGCHVDHWGTTCDKRCNCENGYCNDDINGDGKCYCTLMSYGPLCRACDGIGGSCNPLKGICNSGPDGDGTCKFCYPFSIDIDIEIGSNISNTSIDFQLSDKYGPQCQYNCSCNMENGICYTTGNITNSRAGECIYCTNSNAFGANCSNICNCDDNTEYCQNGVSGGGCIKYDYGGLLKNKGWQFYTIIASALFVVFFSITWWQTNKQYKQQNNGQSIPWCPVREKKNDDDDHQNDNDLKENMINKQQQQHLQNDPNEPPAVSHMIHSNGGNGLIEQDQDEQYQRFDI